MSVVPVNVPVSTSVPTLTLAAGSAGGVAIASTIDPAVDYLLIYTSSAAATQGINRNTLLGLSSQPLGLSDVQSPTNKTFGVTNTFTPLDGSFTLKNTADPTKLAIFSLAGITTGTTRTYTLPNASGTLMDLASSQTATNKTLTSPTINSPTITNATISSDAITGYTVSGTGTIYGIGAAAGAFTTSNIINTAAIQANAVTAAKLQYGIMRQRQGGTTGDATWQTTGTSNTDTTAKAVFFQSGVVTSSASAGVTVTFPAAYSQVPLVFVQCEGTANGFWAMVDTSPAVTTTQFVVTAWSATGTLVAKNVQWLAVGQ